MLKTTRIESALTPDGDEIALYTHDGQYSIRVNGLELMSTRQSFSEEHLASVICDLYKNRNIDLLIGGLGFGFTLRSALSILSPKSRVVVAELMDCVIRWNQNTDLPLSHHELSDPRVRVVQSDVLSLMLKNPAAYDAIILDVDNGPEAFTVAANQSLYSHHGLQKIWRSLRSGGTLGVWSVNASPTFVKTLNASGFRAEVVRSQARKNKGSIHTLFLGHKK